MVEGDGLLNRYTVTSCIEGSNPSPSANYSTNYLILQSYKQDTLFSPTHSPTLPRCLVACCLHPKPKLCDYLSFELGDTIASYRSKLSSDV